MSRGTKRTLEAAIADGKPDAVYLFQGDDSFLKDERVDATLRAFADAATSDFNVDVFRGAETDAAALSTALSALPMMAERRVVVVRDFTTLRKDARAVLDAYLERPASETVLLLVTPAAWKPEASILAVATVVECQPLTEDEIPDWIRRRASALVTEIEDDAVRLLASAAGNDLALLDGELRKLRDFVGNGTIGAAAIGEVVGVSAGGTLDDLIERFCARDGASAAAIAGAVLGQPKATAVSVVLALTSHVLLIGHVLASGGRRPAWQVSKELYAVMGEGKAAVGRKWGDAVRTITGNAERWDRASVDRALRMLADADRALKESSYSEDEQILSTVLLMASASKRSRASAA